ncbi:MAG: ATP-binding cassette domain-containing protein, partial [Bifidobacteriaceae bacterium]|nr:ATP-binding cassette domain-containing protein [Bifidobacteriaceae bacterium]
MRYRYAARVKNISFRYDSKTVLDSLCLDIFEGEWLSIVGSNGTGKSTLARVLACLSSPDEGRIEILGRTVLDFDAPADFDDSDNSENPGSTNSNSADFDSLINSEEYRLARRQIGFVMQNPQDQIIASVAQDDTAFGPENLGVCPEQITQRVEESLRETGMTAYRYSDPEFLSGGQQQRIAIAGSLAMRPKILILDEPTAMADEESRRQILQTLKNANESGTTIIHITHLLNELEFSSRTAIMHNGKIAQICSPEKTAEALKKLQSDDDSNADSGFEPNIKTNTESNIEKILKNEYTAVRIASGSDNAGSDTEKSNKSKTTAEKTAASKSSDGSEIAVKINGLTFSDSDFSNTIFSAASLASPPAPPSISSAVSSSADSSPASSLSSLSPSASPSAS